MAPASNDHPSSYLPQMTQTRRAQHAVLWLFVAQERWNGFVFRYVKRRGEVENSAVQQRCDKQRAIPVPADSQEKLNGSREEEEHRVKRRDKYESVKRWSLCMLYICDLEVKCSCSVCDTQNNLLVELFQSLESNSVIKFIFPVASQALDDHRIRQGVLYE